MACPMCATHDEHTFVECQDAQQESASAWPYTVPVVWDRTRWDRLQASGLVVIVAVVSGAPLWLVLGFTVAW